MKKRLIAVIAAAVMMAAAVPSVGAIDQWSYSEDVTVYVNGDKIDNGQYKPIIVNDRTMVRLVPVFEALGFSHSDLDRYNSVTFIRKGTNETYRFVAEKNYAIGGTGYDEEAVMSGQDTSCNIYFDVPATLQYYDVFYVPIRAFCDIAGLNISWDDATRSVYITENAEAPTGGGNVTTTEETAKTGMEYFCLSRIVGKGVVQEYVAGQHSEDEITSISDSYLEKAVDYHTSNGLKPQKALDLVTQAFGTLNTGVVYTETDYVQAVSEDNDTGYHYFRVVYHPEGCTWAHPNNVPCYSLTACPDENFSDTNTTGIVFDMNNNVIGEAN